MLFKANSLRAHVINGLDSPVLLQLHLLLLLHLHVLLVQVVVALVYLVYLPQIVVIGQRTERIVVDAAHAAAAMMPMSVVAVMRRKVREIICNDNVARVHSTIGAN